MTRSKEGNDRMAAGSTPTRTDRDARVTVSKQGRQRATNDVEEIADDLLALDDRDTALALARVLVRTGDTVGEIAKRMDGDGGLTTDRMEPSR